MLLELSLVSQFQFRVFFLRLFFVCVHLLFSNLGDKSTSDFLDLLLSAVEKRKDSQLLKKNSSFSFLVKE